MQFEALEIPDVKLIKPKRFGDSRGYFSEVFKDEWFRSHIENVTFVQDNESLSAAVGTVRGLHFQSKPFAQGKLIRCTRGALFDVAVDIRQGSPHFGRWIGATLSAENGHQLWVPAGFAHGFMTLEPETAISYKVTAAYSPDHDQGVKWDDPVIAVQWPTVAETILSDKDARLPPLSELPAYFHYRPQEV